MVSNGSDFITAGESEPVRHLHAAHRRNDEPPPSTPTLTPVITPTVSPTQALSLTAMITTTFMPTQMIS